MLKLRERCQTEHVRRSPVAIGTSLAALAAVAFGVATPIVASAGRDVGPLSTAALLYVGAALTALVVQLAVRSREASVRRADLYLLAQRRIGAGRTGSVFALAPFIGASLAWSLGDRHAGWFAVAAGALFAVGVYLHVSERHGHRHIHELVEHEHMHRHDDGHHTHAHDPPFDGKHSHVHHHGRIEHDHEHAPDVHYAHSH